MTKTTTVDRRAADRWPCCGCGGQVEIRDPVAAKTIRRARLADAGAGWDGCVWCDECSDTIRIYKGCKWTHFVFPTVRLVMCESPGDSGVPH